MSTKRRLKLVVAYDGIDFCGWAPQTGRRTVHGTLTDTVRQVSGDDCEITGASRTDSGAHARGQVCHFDTLNPMPVERWPQVLTKLLPSDLSVLAAEEVAPDFHARFSADKRWYRYRIQVEGRDPQRSRYAHYWTGLGLDRELMHASAQALVGNHDFYAFSQEVPPECNTKREIHSIQVSRVRDELRIDVVGNAFLRGMMRRISGCLLEIGRGARDPQTLSHLLNQRSREPMVWPVVLPAHGLCLMKVTYGRHPRDNRTKNRLNLREDDDE